MEDIQAAVMFIADKGYTWEMSNEFDEWAWQQCLMVDRAIRREQHFVDCLPSLDDLSLALLGM